MNGRLSHAIESVIFLLAVTAVFFVVALLVKLIFKKSIGTRKYYSTAMIAGALIYVGLISVLPKPEKADASDPVHSDQITVAAIGLDAQFIAPPKDKMESFVGQLDTAVNQLSPADKASLIEAIGFLNYAAGEYIKENEPARFAKWDQKDMVAHSLNKMYNLAQDNGDKMTLRKYILMADEMKKQKPEWFQQYTAASRQP